MHVEHTFSIDPENTVEYKKSMIMHIAMSLPFTEQSTVNVNENNHEID
jgi:hypothetical protein